MKLTLTLLTSLTFALRCLLRQRKKDKENLIYKTGKQNKNMRQECRITIKTGGGNLILIICKGEKSSIG